MLYAPIYNNLNYLSYFKIRNLYGFLASINLGSQKFRCSKEETASLHGKNVTTQRVCLLFNKSSLCVGIRRFCSKRMCHSIVFFLTLTRCAHSNNVRHFLITKPFSRFSRVGPSFSKAPPLQLVGNLCKNGAH
jgi:hypothetical protein